MLRQAVETPAKHPRARQDSISIRSDFSLDLPQMMLKGKPSMV